MSNQPPDSSNSTGRRAFLKSLLGLGSVLETPSALAHPQPEGSFYWADLKSGQVGFPTGTSVKQALPGSIMKLVAAAAIREHNLLPANDKLECVGSVSINRKKYCCQLAHGKVSLTEAIGQSCNCFFAQAAEHLNPAVFLETARRLKLDQPVAHRQSAAFPKVPTASAQDYVLGLAADLELNALQLMQLVAMIALKGHIPAMHSAEDPVQSTVTMDEPFAAGTFAVLHQGMHLACTGGTAKQLDPENRLHLAAKTGTTPHGSKFQSWIAGFFPYEAPRHVFCARATNGTSQDQAVPLARKYLFATEWP